MIYAFNFAVSSCYTCSCSNVLGILFVTIILKRRCETGSFVGYNGLKISEYLSLYFKFSDQFYCSCILYWVNLCELWKSILLTVGNLVHMVNLEWCIAFVNRVQKTFLFSPFSIGQNAWYAIVTSIFVLILGIQNSLSWTSWVFFTSKSLLSLCHLLIISSCIAFDTTIKSLLSHLWSTPFLTK